MYQFPDYFVRDCLSFYKKLVQKDENEEWFKNCYLHRNFDFLVTKTVNMIIEGFRSCGKSIFLKIKCEIKVN